MEETVRDEKAGILLRIFGGKRRYILLAFVELTVLTASCISYYNQVSHLLSYHFGQEEITSYNGKDDELYFGEMINEEYASGMYVVMAEVFLRKGYYQYSVSYEGGSNGSAVWPIGNADYYSTIEQSVVYLDGNKGCGQSDFWVNSDLYATWKVLYSGEGSFSITELEIEETGAEANIRLFSVVSVLILINILIGVKISFKKHPLTKQTIYVCASLITLAIFSSYPTLVDYAITGQDFAFHLIRIEGIKDALLSGQFPVRINPDYYNGYGYANPIFYGEIFLYVPAFLRLIGFRLTTCYKIYVILVNVLTCFGGYYCFRRMLKVPFIAMFVTILYTLAPFRLLDLYIRAAVGEYTAMAFLPFVVYGLYRVFTEDVNHPAYKWCFMPLVVGLTGVIHTHILTGEMLGGVILLTCIFLIFLTIQRKRFFALLKTVLITIAINLWFLVPFLDFFLTQDIRVFSNLSDALIQNTGLYLSQVIALYQKFNWGSLFAIEGIKNEMPLSLGTSLVLGIILCLVMALTCRKELHKMKWQSAYFSFMAVMLTWMSTVYFPWDKIVLVSAVLRTMVSSLEFIWRFLSLATIAAAVATGFGLLLLSYKEDRQASIVAGTVFCTLSILAGMSFMQECLETQNRVVLNNINTFTTQETMGTAEYVLNSAVHEVSSMITEPRVVGNAVLEEYRREGTNVEFRIESFDESVYVTLPMFHYKGYRITSEDHDTNSVYLVTGDAGVMQINIPAGYQGKIVIKYEGIWYWRLAELMSAVSFAVLIFLAWKDKKKIKLDGKGRKR